MTLQTPDFRFQFPDPLLGGHPFLSFLIECSQVTSRRRIVPTQMPVLPADVQSQRLAVTPVVEFVHSHDVDGLINTVVTVQTCGDLRAIRPLTEGQPSTEFALQADSSPQT